MKLCLSLVGVAVLAVVTHVAAQQNAPAPRRGSLEEQIAQSMRSNPDVLLAEAKLRQAQAELNAARLKVTQDVLKAHHEENRQQQALSEAQSAFERYQKMVDVGQASATEAATYRLAMVDAQAALHQIEATRRYLLGVGGATSVENEPSAFARASAAGDAKPALERPPFADEVAGALDSRVSLSAPNLPLSEALAMLQSAQPSIRYVPDAQLDLSEHMVRLDLADVPLRSVLLAITDQLNGTCFVFREYGVLVTHNERAARMNSPTIPEDVRLERGR